MGWFLHPAHALRSAWRVFAALTGHLFQFHLTEAEGHADSNATAVVFVGRVRLHIRAVVRMPKAIGVLDVVSIDENR